MAPAPTTTTNGHGHGSDVAAESWDMADFVINKGHGVKGLSEMGIKSLPKQFHHPLEERFSHKKILDQVSIPMIDMSKWNDPQVTKSICDAAENWGFFQIVNHGVPLEVLDRVKDATRRFFELPAEEKNKFSKGNSPSNNVRFGSSFLPHVETALEWKDFLSLFYVHEDEANTFWPPICKNEMMEYVKSSEVLVKHLIQVLMEGINVKEIDEEKENILMGSRRVNLNYYPICPNPELTVGVGRHSDISTFTVLLQDDIGGLYVRRQNSNGDDKDDDINDDNNWIHVSPISGSLIINIGDSLQIMSNGKYKSIEHYVVANGSQNRISIPLFVNPKPEAMLCPFPEVLANGEKPIYKPVLCADYARNFYNKAHNGKKTLDFALID